MSKLTPYHGQSTRAYLCSRLFRVIRAAMNTRYRQPDNDLAPGRVEIPVVAGSQRPVEHPPRTSTTRAPAHRRALSFSTRNGALARGQSQCRQLTASSTTGDTSRDPNPTWQTDGRRGFRSRRRATHLAQLADTVDSVINGSTCQCPSSRSHAPPADNPRCEPPSRRDDHR
jgi:hypothetical protein